MLIIISVILVIIGIKFLSQLYLSYYRSSLYWCWDDGAIFNRNSIDTNDISFPKNFLWGTASSSYQCEGPGDKEVVHSNWSAWEPQGIKDGQRCGMSIDHYHRYKEDIQLISNLGCNAYRFSLAWDKIEPIEGIYDQDILLHYHDVLKELKQQSIKPMITFYHFVHPLWFEQRSAFLNPSNISAFARFSIDMFKEFENECQFWCTINEPEIYAFNSYLTGMFPPGHKGQLNEISLVFQHMLQSHVEIYDGIKSIAHQPDQHSIGIVKAIVQIDPWNPLNPLDRYLCYAFDYAVNGCILDFFRTGIYKWTMLGTKRRIYKNSRAPYTNDFIGLNYYSHIHLRVNLFKKPFIEMKHNVDSLMFDMTLPIYPEGLYRACVRLKNEFPRIPIYITENGIADRYDDRRHLFLRRYLYALSQAINKANCDVRGYFYWSLTDNFEWGEGFDMKFGLYHVDLNTQERTLRDGAKYLRGVIQKHRKKYI